MLSLLCNVYRGVRTIPQNRAELYGQCAEMLFERWDASRGLMTPGPLRADARTALQDIALWVFTSPKLSEGVPERHLKRRLSRILAKRHRTSEAANDAAAELIGLWRGRTWILTDVGTSKGGRESLYRFTHRTFLEYFAAIELVRQNPSPSRLWRALAAEIAHGSWDITAQVAIQTLDANYHDAGDAVVQLLTTAARSADVPSRMNMLAFAARNLDGLYATPDTWKTLTDAAVDLCVLGLPSLPAIPVFDVYLAAAGVYRHKSWEDLDESETLLDDEAGTIVVDELLSPLVDLVNYSGEIGAVVLETVPSRCAEIMRDGSPADAAKAFLLFADGEAFMRLASSLGRSVEEERRSNWLDVEGHSQFLNTATSRKTALEAWKAENFWVPIVASRRRLMQVSWALESSSLDMLLCTEHPFEGRARRVKEQSLLEALLRSYLKLPNAQMTIDVGDTRAALAVVAAKVREGSGLPLDEDWLSSLDLEDDLVKANFQGSLGPAETASEESEWDKDVAFGAATLIAVAVEYEQWSIADYSEDQVAELSLGPLQTLEPYFVMRCTHLSGADLPAVGDPSAILHAEDEGVLRRWASRLISFIESRPASRLHQ